MRRPVSDGMLYAPKLSTCSEAQEIKETGNEEGYHRCDKLDGKTRKTDDRTGSGRSIEPLLCSRWEWSHRGGEQNRNEPQGDGGSVRRNGAEPDRARNRDAFTVGQ